MRLEQEIQQKTPFRSPHHRAAVNIIFTHNWLVNQQKAFFKPYGITLQQYNVLRILRGQSPKAITTSAIRERMLDRMSDVSRIVDRLVKKELVTRSTCKSDKRLVDVFISEKGLELLLEIDAKDAIDHSFSALSEDELHVLNDLLDRLRDS